jgi:uncharacterized protein
MIDSIAAPYGARRFCIAATLQHSRNKLLFGAFLMASALCASNAQAQVSIASLGSPVTQNFDSLASTGAANAWTDNSTLPGWYATFNGGTGAFGNVYRADTGSNNAGALYSYGIAGTNAVADRALGSLSSGTPGTIYYGMRLVNSTGAAITSLTISYNGEEWRNGGNTTPQKLSFTYQIGAVGVITAINTPSTGWIADATLDFTSPIATATAAALDGNAAANRSAETDTLSINLPAGQEIWLRWTDVNDTGNDHGLAIDDLSVTANGTGPITPSLSISNVSLPEGNSGTTNFNFTVTLSASPTADVTVNYATADGSATAPSDYAAASGILTFPAGTTVLTQMISVGVNGDTTIEPDETFNVTLSNPANATLVTATGTGTIQNDDYPVYSIMQIQGHGAASPYANQTVTTPGNVVTAVGPKGFFIQDPAGDGDVSTSDGIYVYLGIAPTFAVGDLVTVTGQVQEYNGSSEIAASPTVTKTGTGTVPDAIELNPSTNPTTGICVGGNSTINPPVDGYQAANFACLDGMLVKMSDGVVTGATMGTGADGVHAGTASGFYATTGTTPRPFREIGAQYPGLTISGKTIPVFDGDPEIVEIYYGGLGFGGANYIYNAGQHFQVTGIIQGYLGTYEIYPQTLTTVGTAPTYPVPVPDSVAGTLTIGTQNMLHFFNNTADGADTSAYTDNCAGTGTSDTCPTAAEYSIRLQKMSKQIREVLKAPVVLGVEEVENRKVANDIVTQIHTDDPTLTYVPYSIPGNDPGGINIGILVRSDVTVNSVTQIYKGTTTTSCSTSGSTCLLNDRPPVLLDGVFNGYHFRLLVIYDRSLINLGVNDYVGTKRTEQAAQVASIVQTLQTTGATLAGAGNAQQAADGTITTGTFPITGDAAVPLIVVGDFNAYEFTDGYVDVTGMIMGTAVATQNQYWDQSGSYVAPHPALFDTGTAATPANHYSYNFDGYAQEIDHILLSSAGQNDFIAIGNAHGNSDVSEASGVSLDPTTAARTSDHDGQVVTLGYVVTPSASANGTISVATVQTVAKNATPVFTVTPNAGYLASVGGTCGGSLVGTTYTTNAVTTNCSVVACFSTAANYSVTTAVNGSNGTISPASQSVDACGSATFTVTPDTGYTASVSGDTCTVTNTSGTTWTSDTVLSACTVTATFAPVSVLVSTNAGSNGTITPSSQNVSYGSTASFTVTPDPGYTPVVTADTCTITNTSGSTWTTSAITSPCEVIANFTLNTYTVTASVAGTHGTITPATQTVNAGSRASFTITADQHYIANVSGSPCSVTSSGGNVWASTPITANCAVSVSFNYVAGFVPLQPARVLDTRLGIGATVDGQFAQSGPVGQNGELDLSVLGRGGVPISNVTAVVLNVTATDPTAAGFVTVWPTGSALPNTSNLNILPGDTIPNLVIVKLGAGNQVSLYNGVGSTDLVADVVGYFGLNSDLTSIAPARLLDTRPTASTTDGLYAGIGPVAANGQIDLPVAGRGGLPATGVGTVVLNVTATNPTAAGYLTVWPQGAPQPFASNLNFVAGLTIPNLVISQVGATGEVSLYNSAGTNDLIADVMGWFPANSELTPVAPARLLETRAGLPTIDGQFQGNGPLLTGGTLDLTVAGRGNIPSSGVSAVVLNVTVTNPTAPGFMTVWPTGSAQPLASNLNFTPGQTIANLVIAKIGSNGQVELYNSAGSTDVIVDVVGWFSGP